MSLFILSYGICHLNFTARRMAGIKKKQKHSQIVMYYSTPFWELKRGCRNTHDALYGYTLAKVAVILGISLAASSSIPLWLRWKWPNIKASERTVLSIFFASIRHTTQIWWNDSSPFNKQCLSVSPPMTLSRLFVSVKVSIHSFIISLKSIVNGFNVELVRLGFSCNISLTSTFHHEMDVLVLYPSI